MENKDITPGMLVIHHGRPYRVIRPDSDRMVELYPGLVLPEQAKQKYSLRTWAYSVDVEPLPEVAVLEDTTRKTLGLGGVQPGIQITDHGGKNWAVMWINVQYSRESIMWTAHCARIKVSGAWGAQRKDFTSWMIENNDASAQIEALVQAHVPDALRD